MSVPVGTLVAIAPAFNGETGERDIWDEIAGLSGHVLTEPDRLGDVVVRFLDGTENYVSCGRLRARPPI
jgi:hypothetical protein